MQPESIPPASNSAIIATNLIRMVYVLINAGSGHMRADTDGSPPTFDVPNADAPAHAPLGGVLGNADRTHLHPNRIGERRQTDRQAGLPRDEPWLPPFRLPASQELQSQP
jgi:hypothetical protein